MFNSSKNFSLKEIKREVEAQLQKISEVRKKIPISLKELLEKEFDELDFLVDGLIPNNSISVISGYPESGKTWIILLLAKAICRGEPFLNRFSTIKKNVLIIEEENGLRELKRRFQKIGTDVTDGESIFILSQENFKIDAEENIEYLLLICKEKNIGVVILDPFVAIHSKSENVAEDMQKVMECLQNLQKEDLTVIFAHHHRKQTGYSKTEPSQALRGSSVIFGRVDSHLAVEKKDENEAGFTLIITPEKLRQGKKLKPFEVKFYEEDVFIKAEFVGEAKEEELKIKKAEEIILEVLEDKKRVTRKEILLILKEEGIGESTTDRALKELEQTCAIISKKMGKEKVFFTLNNENKDLLITPLDIPY